MTPRRQRMVFVGVVVAGIAVATVLALRAIGENMLYFFSPSELLAGDAPPGRSVRIGGLVVAGSVRRDEGAITVRFDLTDTESTVPVSYTGILPDLFREGQGIVATGRLGPSGLFVAEEVLAKHDENYMPPEVAEAIETAAAKGTMPHGLRPSAGRPPN